VTCDLRLRTGGDGGPVLLLLHGMGATSEVWTGCETLLARDWPGRWVAPDLPGHGASAPLSQYSFDALAASVASAMRQTIDLSHQVVVLGHSLGGVIGLTLADATMGIGVHAVIGVGVKTQWTDADLDRARGMAQRPVAWFESRDEAGARYLRVSGLDGLVPVDDPAVTAGLREENGRWRLAMDPAVFAIGAPDMPDLLARAQARVLLARGEHDPMVTDDDLKSLGTPVATLPWLGHNAHVESPESVVSLCIAAL
jgi:pimeloyl-ACP methyl ester carboxylesterase